MEVILKKGSANDNKTATLVVFVPKQKKQISLPGADESVVELLQEAFEEGAFSGSTDESIWFRRANVSKAHHILCIGYGNGQGAEAIRRASAVALKAARSNKSSGVAFDLTTLLKPVRNLAEGVQAATEGVLLGSYDFDHYKSKSLKHDDSAIKLKKVVLLASSKMSLPTLKKGLDAGKTIGEAVNFGRWLGDHPGNLMTPTILANETAKAAKGTGVKVTIWDKARIKKEKMGGLYGVALGSSQEPRFIIMEYKGAGASKKPLALVGKGLTFDSGGISIKPAQVMDEMKYDMCGGATAIATMLAIAKLKLKVNVTAYIPSSENMPGPAANKPGDILIARNGKSMEVLNTDAEGRLILADALAYASEKKPKAILDAATLTGAMVVALGNTHTGFFTRDDSFAKKVEEASGKSDELVWRMPLIDFHVKDMKGNHADLANISAFRGAGSSTAAAFLEQFVGEDIPFVHFDIAGTAWNQGNRYPYVPKKGATGALIRTWIEFIKAFK